MGTLILNSLVILIPQIILILKCSALIIYSDFSLIIRSILLEHDEPKNYNDELSTNAADERMTKTQLSNSYTLSGRIGKVVVSHA